MELNDPLPNIDFAFYPYKAVWFQKRRTTHVGQFGFTKEKLTQHPFLFVKAYLRRQRSKERQTNKREIYKYL